MIRTFFSQGHFTTLQWGREHEVVAVDEDVLNGWFDEAISNYPTYQKLPRAEYSEDPAHQVLDLSSFTQWWLSNDDEITTIRRDYVRTYGGQVRLLGAIFGTSQ